LAKLLALVAIGCLAAGPLPAIQRLIADETHVRIAGPSRVELPPTSFRDHLFVVVENDVAPHDFPEDHFRVGASFVDWPLPCRCTNPRFESTYGMFELVLADVTGDDIEELLLVRGRGRGTGVRTEELDVFEVGNNGLKRIFSHPVSGRYGISCKWSYTVTLDPHRDSQRPRVRLSLDPASRGECPPEALPIAVSKTYVHDDHLGRLVLEEWQRGSP
jgi:hypothetical protein